MELEHAPIYQLVKNTIFASMMASEVETKILVKILKDWIKMSLMIYEILKNYNHEGMKEDFEKCHYEVLDFHSALFHPNC